MIKFIQKNLLLLLIGAIIGGVIGGFAIYGTMLLQHNRSKNKLTATFEKRLSAKDVLLSECIAKESHVNNNAFNPTIDKNKKGTIVVSPCPEIKQSQTFTPVRAFKEGDTIGNMTLVISEKLCRKNKRRLSK